MINKSEENDDLPKISCDDPATHIAEGCCYAPTKKVPKVAIIGAGPSGLCAARHFLTEDSGFTGVVFERGSTIGGTWVYTDGTGKDEFGQPIHSPLYYGLETNLPKEMMEYMDFPFDIDHKSYLSSAEVLDYLNKYASHFNLLPHIKFNHLVKRVSPVGKSWSLTALDLVTQTEHVSLYDAIIVCSGPTSIPVYPKIEGLARFSGKQLHAKEFRRGEAFKGQRVLVIGLGPSGIDISYKLRPHAKQIFLSHNRPGFAGNVIFPEDINLRPAAASMLDKTVSFIDGTTVDVDVVIHCTGYTYNFPFLTRDCGLVVDQCVSPLYLHLFNIENPSMALLGLLRHIPFQYCVELQTRAFKAVLSGESSLPSVEDMLKDTELDRKTRIDEGQRKKDLHKMGKKTKEYFDRLQELAGDAQIPNVRYSIFTDAFKRPLGNFNNFRAVAYKIIDDDNFEVEYLETPEEIKETVPQITVDIDNNVTEISEDIDRVHDEDTVDDSQGEVTPKRTEESPQLDKRETEEEFEIVEIQNLPDAESVQNAEDFESTVISTVQNAMKSSSDEVITENEINKRFESIETSTSETVETIITRRTVTIDDNQTVNTIKVQAIVENNCRDEETEKCEKLQNGEQQLSEGIVTKNHHDDENTAKHR